MSRRAIETLSRRDLIACEDSRHTQKLLNHFDIHTKTMSLHQHNERERIDVVVDRIRNGETIALVSDAGMPAISDPGEVIVAAVAAAGLTVSVIPGASAVLAAVAVSGLPTERFCFEGFLPRKGAERSQRLDELAVEHRTSVIYESPQRIAVTIDHLITVCGADRPVAMVRELTKIHEEVWRGTHVGLAERLKEDVKGECVLVLGGAPVIEVEVTDQAIADALAAERASGSSKKTLSRMSPSVSTCQRTASTTSRSPNSPSIGV